MRQGPAGRTSKPDLCSLSVRIVAGEKELASVAGIVLHLAKAFNAAAEIRTGPDRPS